MQTQADMRVRVVALSNLMAMCERVNGFAHAFEVTKVSRSRVHVTYSNPSEYGTPEPMTAVFPSYPNPFEAENPYVVLGEIMRVIGDTWNGEGWQAFQPLTDCPQLWRSGADATDWATREEIEARRK